MGGHKGGEVASAIAVASIYNDILSGLEEFNDGDVEHEDPLALLFRAVTSANSRIYNTGQKYEQYLGMGTTVVVSLVYGDKIFFAHSGDSRLYRARGGELTQMTKDHSLAQALIDRKLFSPEDIKKYAPKNVVTSALGLRPETKIDMAEKQLAPGDIYLLCSDGLTDMVKDEEIHLTLGEYSANLRQATDRLVKMAKRAGGIDNISMILAKIPGHSETVLAS